MKRYTMNRRDVLITGLTFPVALSTAIAGPPPYKPSPKDPDIGRRGIPRRKEENKGDEENVTLTIKLTKRQKEVIERAAKKNGLTIEQWSLIVLLRSAIR